MEVIGHNYPTEKLQLLVPAAVIESVDDNVATGRGSENWQPIDNRGSDEMSMMFFANSIATGTIDDGEEGETEFQEKKRSQTEFGNENREKRKS